MEEFFDHWIIYVPENCRPRPQPSQREAAGLTFSLDGSDSAFPESWFPHRQPLDNLCQETIKLVNGAAMN